MNPLNSYNLERRSADSAARRGPGSTTTRKWWVAVRRSDGQQIATGNTRAECAQNADQVLAVVARQSLAGLHEVATMMGVSRQRADQLVRYRDFPKPIAELKGGRIWRASEIGKWMERHGRS